MKKKFDFTGKLIPCNSANGKFILLKNNDGSLLLPIFSNATNYLNAAKWANFEVANCVKVSDQKELLQAILEFRKQFDFKIALDVTQNEKGNTCFSIIEIEA